MTNKFLFLVFFLSISMIALSQEISRKDANSMLVALKKSKADIDRMDLLLKIAQFHIFKPSKLEIDFDSAAVYINEAKEICRKVKSSSTDGYLLLTESCLTKEKGNKEEGKKNAEKAV